MPRFRIPIRSRFFFLCSAALLTALAVSACGDEQVLQPSVGEALEQAGPAGGFRVVLLGQGHGPNSAQTLQEAVTKVAAGGTIRVFPGTWEADGVVIDRPMTIHGQGGSRPTLRIPAPAPGSSHSAIEVRNAGGTVTFRDLVIDNTEASNLVAISAQGTPRVALDAVDILVHAGGQGVLLSGTGAGETLAVDGGRVAGGIRALAVLAGRLEVSGTSFADQGQFGVYGALASEVEVTGSDFERCGSFCVYVVGGGATAYSSLTVNDVTATDCGEYSCIYTINWVDVSITGNRLSNTVASQVNPFNRNVVFLWLSRGEISDNEIDGCGHGACIAVSGSSDADVVGNRVTAYGSQLTRIGIVVSDGALGAHRASTAQVRDNRVIGVGSNPTNAAGHAIGCFEEFCGAITVEGSSTAELTGNEVSNANSGFYARAGGTITGRDNRATNVRIGVQILDAGSAETLRFNDIQGASHQDVRQWGVTSGSDLTCNWWGSAAGPQAVDSPQGAAIYTPWATAAVAGTGATSCSGS
jgi:hypothetical protein